MIEKHGAAYYFRFCDDTFILAESKKELWRLRECLHEESAKLGLTIKSSERIAPISAGMDTSQGDDRYLVSFKDKATGEWGKFFTASEEMKNILDQISDIEDGYPFETTIVSEIFDGNKQKFSFT